MVIFPIYHLLLFYFLAKLTGEKTTTQKLTEGRYKCVLNGFFKREVEPNTKTKVTVVKVYFLNTFFIHKGKATLSPEQQKASLTMGRPRFDTGQHATWYDHRHVTKTTMDIPSLVVLRTKRTAKQFPKSATQW